MTICSPAPCFINHMFYISSVYILYSDFIIMPLSQSYRTNFSNAWLASLSYAWNWRYTWSEPRRDMSYIPLINFHSVSLIFSLQSFSDRQTNFHISIITINHVLLHPLESFSVAIAEQNPLNSWNNFSLDIDLLLWVLKLLWSRLVKAVTLWSR